MRIRKMEKGDEQLVLDAAALFDRAPDADATTRFLGSDTHHLFIVFQDDEPVGFVSGVEMTHPDKGTEMFLYELGVDERFRRRGIGTALVISLRDLARARGCYGMWVLVDDHNEAALATYRKSGSRESSNQTMLSWDRFV